MWKRHVLVVANATATSAELLSALKDRASQGPVSFSLVIPATPFSGGRAAALIQLEQAVELLRHAGVEVTGRVGDGDPLVAVVEAWHPTLYDEIIVSTLPVGVSKWLGADLPRRIERHTGALVTHVVVHAPRATTPSRG
jgi:hypothetical protein